MIDSASEQSPQLWHSNDLLIRIARGESQIGAPTDVVPHGTLAERVPVAGLDYGRASLALIAGETDTFEKLSALRSSSFEDRTLVVFGARHQSLWALNALVGRYTEYAQDWKALRAEVVEYSASRSEHSRILDGISLDRLFALCELLHERDMDVEAEVGLLRFISARMLDGRGLAKKHTESFVERLLQRGLGDEARALLPRLTETSWLRHALTTELAHPRFGGSTESLLAVFNEPYHRLGIEPIGFGSAREPAFEDVVATPRSDITAGPLVSVIMTIARPREETLAAVRSIVRQTYANWELVIVDDGSPEDFASRIEEISEIDERVRVVRNQASLGVAVRRNEALQLARGEFVAVQEPDEWSHPRRLETQVRELLSNPTRLANLVHAIGVADDFSLTSRGAAGIFPAESSLMFRRQAATSIIGFFDLVADGAYSEYRSRLDAATRGESSELVAGAPLLIRKRPEELSSDSVGTGIWVRPDVLTYASGVHDFAQRIRNGSSDPFLPAHQVTRPFHAPDARAAVMQIPLQVDVLLVLDGRKLSARERFLNEVVDELKVGADAGLRIALLQSDSLAGPRANAYFPHDLQELVNAGIVTRVEPGDDVRAATVVVRHAGAAQGHPPIRLDASASRVVVIEDSAATDVPGQTIARADVVETVTAWFGVEPEWIVALPPLPSAKVAAVSIGQDIVRVTVTTPAPGSVRVIRLKTPDRSVELAPVLRSAESVTAEAAVTQLHSGEWAITLDADAGDGRTVLQQCPISSDAVIWNHERCIVMRTKRNQFRLLTDTATDELPAAADFAEEYLSASVGQVAVRGGRVQLTIEGGDAATVTSLYALREVAGFIVRRRDFTSATTDDGLKVWQRPLTKFADSRWRLYATFRTPLGAVEFPLKLDASAKLIKTEAWQPQALSGSRIYVTSPVPNRLARARRRLDARFGGATKRHGKPIASATKMPIRASSLLPRLERVPVVSVVMPVYNVEPYLDQAISSVLDQDFRDLELIIVDDASTDNSREIIEKYWRKDKRVRAIGLTHNTLGGAGIPSNIGIRAARGTYIAFADSDDHVSPTALAKLVELAESNGTDLVIGDFRTFSDKVGEETESYDRKVWADLPTGRVISAFSHPDLFRLSPVPWRKLYRREFLEAHGILYPEGDYFYEDNPLHWFVLSRAQRVMLCDEVVSYHRMEREGQTMSAQAFKLGAFVNHVNSILNFLEQSTDKRRDVLFEALFGFLNRTHWVITNQKQPAAAALIRRGFGEVYERAVAAAPTAVVPPDIRPRLATYRSAYPDVDLTVVIPVFNSSDLLRQTLDSVLGVKGITCNILLIDDGSTDNSLAIMREYETKHANVHVFEQGNRGAGRARNAVIPLASGRYTFFLDADDLIDARALAAAVRQADAASIDLLFFKYRIEYTDEGRSQDMFGADRDVWQQLLRAKTNADRQHLVAQLINYPWNRIIRTSLLHDANIFFGPTIVHNDVLFHWHSIVSAQNIGFLDASATIHRKFEKRQQVTNINDERRMVVLDALSATNDRIAGLSGYSNVREAWVKFTLHLVEWAQSRIPETLQDEYGVRTDELVRSLSGTR